MQEARKAAREERPETPPADRQPDQKPPPENPPVDEQDLERGRQNLDRVIPK
jgi:hypothetical protein